MDLKRNAAGRTPAASTTDADASKDKSHHTTKNFATRCGLAAFQSET